MVHGPSCIHVIEQYWENAEATMKAAGLDMSKQKPQYQHFVLRQHTIIFSVMCYIALFDKSKCKNLPDDLISILVRIFCLVSDENIRQALQNYFCEFSFLLLFPSYCHV